MMREIALARSALLGNEWYKEERVAKIGREEKVNG
jgi:hypothetical protein